MLQNKCPAKPGSEAGTKNSRAQSQSPSGPKGNTCQEQWQCFPGFGEGLKKLKDQEAGEIDDFVGKVPAMQS